MYPRRTCRGERRDLLCEPCRAADRLVREQRDLVRDDCAGVYRPLDCICDQPHRALCKASELADAVERAQRLDKSADSLHRGDGRAREGEHIADTPRDRELFQRADQLVRVVANPLQRLSGLMQRLPEFLVDLLLEVGQVQPIHPRPEGVGLCLHPVERRSGADRAVVRRTGELPQPVFHVRGRVADLRERLVERRLIASGVDDLLIVLVKARRRGVVACRERVDDKLLTGAFVRAVLQREVEVVLRARRGRDCLIPVLVGFGVGLERDAEVLALLGRPVDRVRENARDLSGPRRLVGGLYKALDRQRVAERAVHACCDARPLGYLFLVLRHVGEQLRGFGCGVRIAQNRIKITIALAGHIGGKARRLKAGVQLALRDAVLLGCAVERHKGRREAAHRRARRHDALLRPALQGLERVVLEFNDFSRRVHHAVVDLRAALLRVLRCLNEAARHVIAQIKDCVDNFVFSHPHSPPLPAA